MRKDSGFSLGELITIMGILSVMAVIAMPSLLGSRSNANLRRAAQDLYATFQKTKIEAVRQNEFWAIRFTPDEFMIYIETQDRADTPYVYTEGADVDVSKTAWSKYPGVIPPGDKTFFFQSNGFCVDQDNMPYSDTITLNNKANKANRISVTAAGKIKVERLGG